MGDYFGKSPFGLGHQNINPSNLRTMDEMYNILEKKVDVNVLNNTGPYTSVVLEIVDQKNLKEFDIEIPNDIDIDNENLVVFYFRNQMLHSLIEDPTKFDKKTAIWKNLVKMHPIVFATANGVDNLSAGDFVLIDFKDRNNFSQPVFLSKIKRDPLNFEMVSISGDLKPFNGVAGASAFNMVECLPVSPSTSETDSISTITLEGLNSKIARKLSEASEAKKNCNKVSSISDKDELFKYAESKMRNKVLRKPFEVGMEKLGEFRAQCVLQSAYFLSIIEDYWKRGYGGRVEVIVTSLIRTGNPNSQHYMGTAMDTEVHVDGRKMPVRAVYSALKDMIYNKLIPDGGLGLYLNVKGVLEGNAKIFETSGASNGGEGGSESVHWDWRGHQIIPELGGPIDIPQGMGKNPFTRKGHQRWIWFDLNQDGRDDLWSVGASGGKWDGDTSYVANPRKGIPVKKITRSQIKEYYPEAYELVWGNLYLETPGVPIIGKK